MSQLNKSIGLIFLIVLAFLTVSDDSLAQNPLNLLSQEQKTDQYIAPTPNKLTTNWWQIAIENAPKDQPYSLLISLSEQLLSQLKAQPDMYSLEDSQAINQFHTNVFEIQKRATNKISEDDLVYEDSTPYQLTDIFERLKELRQLNLLLSNQQNAAENFITDTRIQRQHIDQLVIHYGSLDIESPERTHTGLTWMAYRSWVALNELQTEQSNIQISQTEKNIAALSNHIDKMRATVKPNPEDVTALERQIQINVKALETAQIQVLQSNQTFAQSQSNDSFSGLESDINKLHLAQNVMSQRRLELALARDYTHLDWINNSLNSDKTNKTISNERLELDKQLIDKTQQQMLQWRELAHDLLLAPVTFTLNSPEARTAFEKRTQSAQQLLLGMAEISSQQDKVSFLLTLLGEQISEPQSGISLWWTNIKNLGTSVIDSINHVVNKPLFRINETPITLRPLLQLVVILLIGLIFSKLARFILGRMESKRDSDHSPLFFVLNKLTHYFIVIVIVLASFSTLGINLSNLTLIAGALSVGIGFGLQNIVSNFVSGLTIMFERSLKVGDYIELESGITGSVKEINARSTRINTNDNIDVVIPNSDLVTNQIINWTLRDSIKRVKIPFGVAYGTDKELVKKAAQEAAEKVPFTLTNMKGKEPEVWMTGFGDNSIDFVLLVWVSKYGVRRPNRIKASFLWELDSAFIQYGIEVPFPQRVIHYAKPARTAPIDNTKDS